MSSLIKVSQIIPQGRHLASRTCRKLSSGCGPKSEEMNKNYSKRMIKFKKLQARYQRDDGKPIFLKGGTPDRVLYLSTLGLGVIGVFLSLKYFASYIFDDK